MMSGNGMPCDFTIQTLFSRSYIGTDKPGNPDFHGLATPMPYDVSDSHDSDTIDITITHPPLPSNLRSCPAPPALKEEHTLMWS